MNTTTAIQNGPRPKPKPTHKRDGTDEDDHEPVLLVPPKLAKSSYAILLAHNHVARPWHTEGRYGSRTHAVVRTSSETGTCTTKIGLPILNHAVTIRTISSFLRDRSGPGPPTDSKSNSLHELLGTEGVELIHETPFVSNKKPKVEAFDARFHPERMPPDYPSRMRDFLKTYRTEPAKELHSSPSNSSSSSLNSSLETFKPFTYCELFSGIGGFGVALESLGGKCVFASDIHEPAKRIYEQNLDCTSLQHPHGIGRGRVAGDIWTVDAQDIPPHDLLVGGFPCQPFSRLGTQPGLSDRKATSGRRNNNENGESFCIDRGNVEHTANDESTNENGRGMLFTQIVRILKHRQPKAFLLENVPGLIHTDGGRAFQTILTALESAGYAVTTEVVSSRGLTTQSRKRLYLVGIHTSNYTTKNTTDETPESGFQFPFLPDLKLTAMDVLHTNEELDTSASRSNSHLGVPNELWEGLLQPQPHPPHTASAPADAKTTPASYFRLSNDQMDQLRHRSKSWKPAKLSWDNTTHATLTSHYGSSIGKGNSQLVPSPAPHHPRRFTPRECARIMGFPNSFRLGPYRPRPTERTTEDEDPAHTTATIAFQSYIKEQYFVLGNAVCPPVISALAGAILDHLEGLERNNGVCVEAGAREGVDPSRGIWIAIRFALDALAPHRKAATLDRLGREYSAS